MKNLQLSLVNRIHQMNNLAKLNGVRVNDYGLESYNDINTIDDYGLYPSEVEIQDFYRNNLLK